jgi:hypothetical protein
MNATTKTTLDLAKTLAKSGFHIPAIELHTPDGRTWNIATVPAGRGRHLDGHWGPRPGALGGFACVRSASGKPLGSNPTCGSTAPCDPAETPPTPIRSF